MFFYQLFIGLSAQLGEFSSLSSCTKSLTALYISGCSSGSGIFNLPLPSLAIWQSILPARTSFLETTAQIQYSVIVLHSFVLFWNYPGSYGITVSQVKLALPEIQGTIEEITLEKCRAAAASVRHFASPPSTCFLVRVIDKLIGRGACTCRRHQPVLQSNGHPARSLHVSYPHSWPQTCDLEGY